MRGIILLLLTVVALAILRMLVNDVGRAVSKAFKTGDRKQEAGAASEETPRSAGRLVRDPQTGAYVDEASAIKQRIGDEIFFFESPESRDAFLRTRDS